MGFITRIAAGLIGGAMMAGAPWSVTIAQGLITYAISPPTPA